MMNAQEMKEKLILEENEYITQILNKLEREMLANKGQGSVSTHEMHPLTKGVLVNTLKDLGYTVSDKNRQYNETEREYYGCDILDVSAR